jgi:DNA-binding transcriptional ArsR family regulator
MGWWQVSADTMAGSRFTISPLAETTACLIALERDAPAHPGERAWLDAHLPAYRAHLADDPITALLLRAAMNRRWIADFLTPTPTGRDEATFLQETARVRGIPQHVVEANLEVALDGPVPEALRRPGLADRAADLLEWVWTRAVLPEWPQRRRIIEADILARTRQLSLGGWAAALDDMRPNMRWLGDGKLQINGYDYPPREISGAQLLFVPVTSGRGGWVCWDEPHRYAIVYPCSGALAEPDGAPAPDALSRLLGPARARILVLLDTPKSTTQLVALTGQRLGSVGGHLKILLDARLLLRRRAGRSVLYSRTAAGDALIRAQSES